MKKILDRINKMDQYESWKFVKQNYQLNVVRNFIKIITLFQNQSEETSFGKFCEKNSEGNKTLANFRNARTLMELGIIENVIIDEKAKIHYKDYKISQKIEDIAFNGNDEELKQVLVERMLLKDKIFKQKSNKHSTVSTSDEVLLISPYVILIKTLIKLYNKTKNAFISKKEVSNFIVAILDESEIDAIIELIMAYRKDNTILDNEIKENRFHNTLELIPGITKNKSGFSFDPKVLGDLIGVEQKTIVIHKKYQNAPNLEEEDLEYLKGVEMAAKAEIKVRNSKIQKDFREKLLKEFGNKCALCDLEGSVFMIASHAKSFADCNRDNEIKSFATQYNGLLLCRNHDALFDSNKISINESGEVVGNDTNLHTIKSIANKLWWNKKRKAYLKYHFDEYTKKHKKK